MNADCVLRWILAISAKAMLEVRACCFLFYTVQTTNHHVYRVLLWNSKWEELQGHMVYPSSLDEFLIVNQSLPATDNLSVIQRNDYVNCM